MTTNVPQPTFTATGFQAPPASAVLSGVQADYQTAFGQPLNFTTSSGGVTNPTPQGQLAQSQAAIIDSVNALFLLFTGLVDPALTYGRMQDAIARIYFIERNAATSTVVLATCYGLVGVTIPPGSLAADANGNQYVSLASATIGGGGSVQVQFAAVSTGPIVCAAGALNTIITSVPGWDSISNAAAGTLGTNGETSQQFESRRFNSVSTNSIGWYAAIRGAVLSVPNVVDCYVIDNPTNSSASIGGVTLPANGLYIAVVGGNAQAVGQAIFKHKNPGSVYYAGNTSVTVYDTQAGYYPPYPSYGVFFNVPYDLQVTFSVQMANNGYVPSNALALIQAAIVGAFSGLDGGPPARIGGTMFAARFITTLAGVWTNSQVVSVQIGSLNTSSAQFTASLSGTNMTVSAVASGTLAATQTVCDKTGTVLPGTTIVSQSSGTTGGTGVYVVSTAQTVASETLYGVVSNQAEVVAHIDQFPSIASANIVLALV